jgi:hypothetical protein
VLYLVRRTIKKGKDDHVISLSKMKTGEYRIFRKLREKLKIFTAKHAIEKGEESMISFVKENIERFKSDINDFQLYSSLPCSMDFYG